MASPCPRCGTTKTESVRHGFVHDKLWNFGYHLRRCSFCNRWRVFKRADPNRPHPDDLTVEELQESFNRRIARSLGEEDATAEGRGGNMDSDSSKEPSEMETQDSTSSVGVEVTTDEVEDYQLCPKCGSTLYHRSRRRWYERLLKRPRMARCLKCDHRFPYPH